MSRIVFHRIEFQNFMSYGNYTSSLDLDKNNLTLIQGDNGAGKTTALLALSYNLFGKTFNKVVKASLINKKNKKGLVTRSWFTIGNDNYYIERGEKPSIFKVVKNDKEMEIEGDSREFQKRLEEEILQFDLKEFTRLICLGYNYIRFFELTTPERREFIESVLDLSSLSDMSKQIKEFHKSDNENVNSYNLMLNGKKSNKDIYEKQLQDVSKDNETLKLTCKEKLDKLKEENNNKTYEIIEYDKQLEQIKAQIDINNNDIKDLTDKNNKIKEEATKINTFVGNNNKLLEFLSKNDQCPTCKQMIDKTFKDGQIKSLNKQNEDFKTKLDELKSLYYSNDTILNNYKQNNDELNKNYRDITSKILSCKEVFRINEITIKEETEHLSELENNENINNLRKNIEETNKDIKDFEEKIEKLNKRLEVYKTTLEILSESGVKKALIDNYIDVINQKVNEYLEDFGCSFDFNMDNEFNETINLDFHDDVKYESLSAGQKQRLDISIFLTFRAIAQMRSKVSANILLLDEILDTNLDDEGVRKIIDILLKQDKINILAISHNTTCKELFDNVVNVKKEKYGFSRIIQ